MSYCRLGTLFTIFVSVTLVSCAVATPPPPAAASNVAVKETISTFFAAGDTCEGKPEATVSTDGSTTISLCAKSTEEWLCGSTVKLEPQRPEDSGSLELLSIQHAPGLTDPNSTVKFPLVIASGSEMPDLGSTSDTQGVSAIPHRRLATYRLRVSTHASASAITLKTRADSSLGVRRAGSCGNAVDAPLVANILIRRQ